MKSAAFRLANVVALIALANIPVVGSNTAMAAKERVGVAAAVNPATTGTPPGGNDRLIVVGSKMMRNERIVTLDKGRTQLLFLDGSALTIGPNSEVVLDEFVYDPKSKVGKLAFSATKGLFRLVGGKISKKTPVIFKTPTAVIGIRGGIALVTVREVNKQAGGQGRAGLAAGSSDDHSTATAGTLRLAQANSGGRVVTTAQLAFGQLTVQSGGVTRTVNVPGFQVVAASVGKAPSQPARAKTSSVSFAGLEGTGGTNTSGAPEAPTNEDVAKTQISSIGSNIQPANIVSAASGALTGTKKKSLSKREESTTTKKQTSTVVDPTATVEKQTSTVVDSTTTAQQNQAADTTAGTEGGDRKKGIGNDFVYGGRLLSQTPFQNFDFSDATTTRKPLRNENGGNASVSGGFLSVTSEKDGTIFRLPVKTGTFDVASSKSSTRFGPVAGSGFGAPDESFFYWNLREIEHGNNPASIFVGVPFTSSFPTTGIDAHDLLPGFPNETSIPMLPSSHGGDFNGRPTPLLYSAYSPNLTTFPNDARSVALYGSIAIDGVGVNQRSAQVAYIGTYFSDSLNGNKPVLSGFSRGSVRLTASGRPIRVDGAGGATSRDGNGNSFFGTSGPDYFVISSDRTNTTTTLIDAAGFVQTLENTGSPAKVFFQENYARPAPLPNGVGNSRTARTLNGYVAGLVTVKDSSSSFPVYIAKTLSDTPNSFKIVTNPSTNRLYGSIKTEDTFDSQSALVIPLGNPSGASRSRQAFIDDNIFGVRESTSSTPTVGGEAGTGKIALLTSGFTSLSGTLTSGVSFCTCSHTKWGFISGEVREDDYSERHRFHLVPWVAGELSGSSITSALTGSATYTGHVAANIKNNGKQYVAFGNYDQAWNFSSRSGTATISNLDGASYTGGISGVSGSGGSEFHGTISGSQRNGSLQGAFMRAAGNSAEEVALQFHVTGNNYYAAGVGLGKAPD